MSKPQWICVICAEDFTRKSSGTRHMNNSNIHSKKPIIVRYIDYIIGLVKGDYPPPINPSRLQRGKPINNISRITPFLLTTIIIRWMLERSQTVGWTLSTT